MEIPWSLDFPVTVWDRGDPQNESSRSVRFIWGDQDLRCTVWQGGQSESCLLGSFFGTLGGGSHVSWGMLEAVFVFL